MRIEQPRVLPEIEVNGKMRMRVGYAQWLALNLLSRVAAGQEPPDGIITPTGMLRKHIFPDMISLGLVQVEVKGKGLAHYYLTTLGKQVLAEGVHTDPPKEARREFSRLESLIQRARKAVGRPRLSRAQVAEGARRVA